MKSKDQTCDVFFDVFEPRLEQWIPTKFKAKCVKHDEESGSDRIIYRLFKVGVLAKVLGRRSDTIRVWQRSKLIPEPRFVFDGDTQRWYSEEQIRMIAHHQRNILGDDPRSSKGRNINTEAFFEAVREDWNLEYFDPEDYTYDVQEVQTGEGDVHVQ
jgi:hypothetical protein